MPMYYLIEYSDDYSKTSGSLWQYYRDQTALDNAGVIIFWPKHVSSESVNNDAAMFKFSGYLFGHI